jgi:dTMP kinase
MAERTVEASSDKPRPPGLLVTLDGPAGVGKTTVSELMASQLSRSGCLTLHTAQPSRSPLGELARHGTYDYYGAALSCLVAADRYDHAARVIEPALARGVTVVCDRYVASALALDRLDGLDESFIDNIYRYLRPPDLAIFLTAQADTCVARIDARGRHSRFHHHDVPTACREGSLYREAASRLEGKGIPIVRTDTTAVEPAVVAKYLTDLFLAMVDVRQNDLD